ncbi:MAG TPA: nuclear transport factor 2 family protein [Candidatus Acidoferrales bacterium]|nr:nuclear transport factor 2 family protein [Candidatus Acidoferrales bacterium]
MAAATNLTRPVFWFYLARMKKHLLLWTPLAVLLSCLPMVAQEPVVGVANPESLFTSPDPKLNANKQAALHIMRDLLEANHWDEAGKYITTRYIQHNPNVASGLEGVVKYFTATRKPSPIPEHMKTEIVAVVAEGDYVIVVRPREYTDPRNPSKKYTTTWFDMWLMKDAKADEHWDGALINPPAPPKSN